MLSSLIRGLVRWGPRISSIGAAAFMLMAAVTILAEEPMPGVDLPEASAYATVDAKGRVWASTRSKEIVRFDGDGAVERTWVLPVDGHSDQGATLAVDDGTLHAGLLADGQWRRFRIDATDKLLDAGTSRLAPTDEHAKSGDGVRYTVGRNNVLSRNRHALTGWLALLPILLFAGGIVVAFFAPGLAIMLGVTPEGAPPK